ncbi:MAG: carbamoyltransferase [Anaerolineae bacterium]|nr:carbamoyltransferase [Anaerolineae bacterium]
MYILGISCFYHDSAAALIKDGELVAAAMEERFTRKKHDNGFPAKAIDFVLSQAGLTGPDLDYAVFYEKPMVKFERILMSTLGTWPRSAGVWREAVLSWLEDRLWVKSLITKYLNIPDSKLLFADHHMSHAASAFFTSPFDEAAVLTIDGVGEWTTAATGVARGRWEDQPDGVNEIILDQEQRFPHSVGLLYSAFTAWLGFKVNNGEYKVMGMSPYGEPKYMDRVYKVFNLHDDGSFNLNMDYFSFHYSPKQTYNGKFVELFGPPRKPESEFITTRTNPEASPNDPYVKECQYYADVSASIQRVTEEALVLIANKLYERTHQKYLVMAGGVALNSVANYKILQETPFEDVFIQPAAGDDGGALGAALWAYHQVLGRPRRRDSVMRHAYYGAEYGEAEIKRFLDSNGIPYDTYEDKAELAEVVADHLANGKVISIFQGRFEWGPRALGNRSILADPRREEMKQIVNEKIKFREPFRPFAPVVLEERAQEYYAIPDVGKRLAPRFMLMVSPVVEDKRDEVPATTHEGGTGRLQTIDRPTNPLYYDIVARFGDITGTPVVLNTSFNLRGEPIVNTPANASWTFHNSDIDMMIMEKFLVRKEK